MRFNFNSKNAADDKIYADFIPPAGCTGSFIPYLHRHRIVYFSMIAIYCRLVFENSNFQIDDHLYTHRLLDETRPRAYFYIFFHIMITLDRTLTAIRRCHRDHPDSNRVVCVDGGIYEHR